MPSDRPFRPSLTPLEDRTTPAASLADAVKAVQTIHAAPAFVQNMTAILANPFVANAPGTKAIVAKVLPPVYEQYKAAVDTLADYGGQLQQTMAASPAQAGALGGVAQVVRQSQQAGTTYASYVLLFAQVFGGYVPPAPPAPPVAPPPPPVDGPPSDSTGIPDSPTSPPVSPPVSPPPVSPPPVSPPPVSPPSTDNSGMSATLPDVNALKASPATNRVNIQDVTVGTGATVKAGDKVSVFYTGWLTTGSQFDSNRTSATPVNFDLDGLIQGWQIGIPGQKVGGIRRLYIPADLAYGSTPRSGIPANSDLVFEIKVVGIG